MKCFLNYQEKRKLWTHKKCKQVGLNRPKKKKSHSWGNFFCLSQLNILTKNKGELSPVFSLLQTTQYMRRKWRSKCSFCRLHVSFSPPSLSKPVLKVQNFKYSAKTEQTIRDTSILKSPQANYTQLFELFRKKEIKIRHAALRFGKLVTIEK